ncbi:MAG: efflux RND transporter permease subunit [Hyphomicrobiales bacterium]
MNKDIKGHNQEEEKNKEFKLTTWALKNKNTIYLLTFILFAFGGYSYVTLPKELFPDIVQPTIMVRTIYPGNTPADIENLVTRPLEKEIESVKGLKKMTSNSSQDASVVFAEFSTDMDVKQALQDVKDAVDKAKKDLPTDLPNDPTVEDIDFSEFPIININLSGNYSLEELRGYAEYLQDELETISEITRVDISGVNNRELRIHADLHKLEANQLSFSDIQNAVMQENVSMSGGNVLIGNTRRTVSIQGEIRDPNVFKNIIIKREKGKIVYLKDVADVNFTFEDPSSFARLNKKPVVSLQVVKKSGENLLSATSQIFNIIDNAQASHALPESLDVAITNDQSKDVKSQLSNLSNSMILGALFVILVLFFFLGSRNAFIVGLAIPLSMFLSFLVLGMNGSRINFMVLFSLILALGMLVDNAIVVVENIFRFKQKGYSSFEASRLAVGEIAMPIISSTATTLAAFFPLLFWNGMIGEFMKYLPMTLIIVLISSLFVALVLLPVYSSLFVKAEGQEKVLNKKKYLKAIFIMLAFGLVFYIPKWYTLANLLVIFAIIGLCYLLFLHRASKWFQTKFLVWLENTYLKVLSFVMKKGNPKRVIIASFLLLFITIGFYTATSPKIKLFPSTDPKYINVVAKMPVGTDINATDSAMRILEKDVYKILKPNMSIVKSILTRVGMGAVSEHAGFSGRMGSSAGGLITIHFLDYQFRNGINTSHILQELSDALIRVYPGIEISVEKPADGPPTGKPINIELIGKDFDKLIALSENIITTIDNSKIPGIEGLKVDLDVGKPELSINIDRDKARRFGISTGQIASSIRTSIYGTEISKYKVGEDEYPIMLRSKDKYRYNIPSLMNQKITFKDQNSGKVVQVPVSSVANIAYSNTYDQINRKDKKRVVTVYSNVLEGYNPTNINNKIRTLLESYTFPEGYKYDITGEQEEQAKSMAFLLTALLIAISLILIILVTQFNSVVKPVIILASVLFSTIGVFGGLATFNMEFIVIMTGIGIVSLAGVVVNNAIVLIDYIDLLKSKKRKELGLDPEAFLTYEQSVECLVEAGKTRLRPVLLTAITTILGLIPLAIGLNIDIIGMLSDFNPNIYFGGDNIAFWGAISWTVIFGLTFSTILTLVVVPCMYQLLYQVKIYMYKKIK